MIKIWELNKEWRNKLIEAQEEAAFEDERKKKIIMESQIKIKKMEDDSEDDDLQGWHKNLWRNKSN